MVHDAIAFNIAKTPDDEENIQKIYEPRLLYLAKNINTKVRKLPYFNLSKKLSNLKGFTHIHIYIYT